MPTESNSFSALVISRVVDGEAGGCSIAVKKVSGLMLKKKILPLMTELVVVLTI